LTKNSLDNFPKVEGYTYSQPFDLDKFIEALSTTGFQATNLAKGVEIVNLMRKDNAFIFLGATSNMVSSGIRETLTFLAKNSHVNCIVTTAGGVEEDIIKCLKEFALGSYDIPGEHLFNSGINRTGNIFVPNDRYAYYDQFMQEFLPNLQKKHQGAIPTNVFIRELGLALADHPNREESYLYWAAKNNIPVVCPALMDGSTGDLIHFYRQQNLDFVIDATADMDLMVKLVLANERRGALIFGAGVAKHYILNANIFAEGLDYAVYINTAEEFDGSDSGARIDEAITWGKIKPRVPAVKIHCDATIAAPLLIAATFGK
jgi:deoxyhypusine synthase